MPSAVIFTYGTYLQRPLSSTQLYCNYNREDVIAYDLNYNQAVGFDVPNMPEPGNNARTNFRREAEAALMAYFVANPAFESDVYCSHYQGTEPRPPHQYIEGAHYWSVSSLNRALSEQLFDCPHCAYKFGLNELAQRGAEGVYPSILFASSGAARIPEDYLPSFSIEINGEQMPATSATIKDGAPLEGVTCGNCGRPGHTVRSCTNGQRHYHKIGIEIEGRFLNLRRLQNAAGNDGLDYCGDSSIYSSSDSSAAPYEFKTKPSNLKEAIEQLVKYYPDETDRSCGMHVHVSFDPQDLTLLHTKAFFAYFKQRWTDWGQKMNLSPNSQFFKRLNGDNDFCEPNESELVDMTNMDRYYQLNFYAYRIHKTLECRMLPMFRRSSLGISAVCELISIYEDFLNNPEECGLSWPDFIEVALNEMQPACYADTIMLDLSDFNSLTHTEQFTLELEELGPCRPGHIRVAFPVNQPITVEALANRLRAA